MTEEELQQLCRNHYSNGFSVGSLHGFKDGLRCGCMVSLLLGALSFVAGWVGILLSLP